MAGKGGSGNGLPNFNNPQAPYLPTSLNQIPGPSAGMAGLGPMGLGILGQGPTQFPR